MSQLWLLFASLGQQHRCAVACAACGSRAVRAHCLLGCGLAWSDMRDAMGRCRLCIQCRASVVLLCLWPAYCGVRPCGPSLQNCTTAPSHAMGVPMLFVFP